MDQSSILYLPRPSHSAMRHRQFPHYGRRSCQTGMTLFELAAASVIFTLFTIPLTQAYMRQQTLRMENKAINEVIFIGESAQAWYIDNGAFPNSVANCVNAITVLVDNGYLGGGGAASPFANNYITDCSGGDIFAITVTAPNDRVGSSIASALPRSSRAGGAVTTEFSIPGAVPALDAYLRRTPDPSFPDANTMKTDLDMDGNDINSVSVIRGQANAPVTVTTTGGLTLQNGDFMWGSSTLVQSQGGSVELGGDDATAGSGSPYIDFHTDGDGVVDYSARIQSLPGNVLRLIASGELRVTSSNVTMSGGLNVADTMNAKEVEVASIGNFALSNVVQDIRVVENGDTIPKPTCPAGKVQGVGFSAESMAEGATPSSFYGWQAFASNASATTWAANVQVFTGLGPVTPEPGYGRVVSQTFCYTP